MNLDYFNFSRISYFWEVRNGSFSTVIVVNFEKARRPKEQSYQYIFLACHFFWTFIGNHDMKGIWNISTLGKFQKQLF